MKCYQDYYGIDNIYIAISTASEFIFFVCVNSYKYNRSSLDDDDLLTLLLVVIAPKHSLKNLYTNFTILFGIDSSIFNKKG